MKHAYIVMTLGFWGRGLTVTEAARNCKKAGGKYTDISTAWIVVGDSTPRIDSQGFMIREGDSESFLVSNNLRLGQLCRAYRGKS